MGSIFVKLIRPHLEKAFKAYNNATLNDAIKQEQARDIKFPAPAYTTLIGGGLRGSGFHFEANGKKYIGSSLHQFDNHAPTQMLFEDGEGTIKVLSQVHKGKDIQVLSYESVDLDEITALKFDPKAKVKNRERVYILSGDKSYEGTIAFHYDDKVNFVVFLREQFVAGGMSGAPIISAQTGTVVAILIGADKANNPVHIIVEKLTIE
ncbi:MAG: serine protease [Lentisphaeria bacterium]|nr:serine protease [Lentisphaeria bacterium]